MAANFHKLLDGIQRHTIQRLLWHPGRFHFAYLVFPVLRFGFIFPPKQEGFQHTITSMYPARVVSIFQVKQEFTYQAGGYLCHPFDGLPIAVLGKDIQLFMVKGLRAFTHPLGFLGNEKRFKPG